MREGAESRRHGRKPPPGAVHAAVAVAAAKSRAGRGGRSAAVSDPAPQAPGDEAKQSETPHRRPHRLPSPPARLGSACGSPLALSAYRAWPAAEKTYKNPPKITTTKKKNQKKRLLRTARLWGCLSGKSALRRPPAPCTARSAARHRSSQPRRQSKGEVVAVPGRPPQSLGSRGSTRSTRPSQTSVLQALRAQNRGAHANETAAPALPLVQRRQGAGNM